MFHFDFSCSSFDTVDMGVAESLREYQSILTYFIRLPLLYMSFNILLYGGIYTVNALSDLENDKKMKPWRPIPSGKVSVVEACILAISLLVAGFCTGYAMFPHSIITELFTCFVVANVTYSFVLKRYDFDVLSTHFIAVTAPLRMLLGATAMGHEPPNGFHLAAAWGAIAALHMSRKHIERGKRPLWGEHILSSIVIYVSCVSLLYNKTEYSVQFCCYIALHYFPWGILPCFSDDLFDKMRSFYKNLT